MRAVITGCGGFVGSYLKKELETHGYEVCGFDLFEGPGCRRVDLSDKEALRENLREIMPDCVFHLAGQANVAYSWKNPQKTFEINVIVTLNLLDVIREISPGIKVLIVGSSDEYGSLKERGVNVTEDIALHPETPYAVSKQTQENLALLYARTYKMNVCCTRSFNHGGAGQKEGFMIPDFCAGAVRIEKGLQSELKVGNLDSKRDFTHVKDVVRAYRLIAEKGVSGEVYNVGSGRTFSAGEVLDIVLKSVKTPCKVVRDASRMRPSDTPVVCCNHDKLTGRTGWMPEFSIEQIVKDCLEYYRGVIDG